MKRISWAFCSCWLLLLAFSAAAATEPVRPRQAQVIFSADAVPPAAGAKWQVVDLPHASDHPVAWYRVNFDAAGAGPEAWAVYLPYLYSGGRLSLNGARLAHIQEPSRDLVVRWARPHLVGIPATLLRPGTNELLIRIGATPEARARLPLLRIGPSALLLRDYDRRFFWVRTMSQFTVISCLVVGALSLFIWWRRREESLYGLFGAASLLWGIRSLTLIVEVLPAPAWHAWRTIYHGATGGFTLVMLLFAMTLAGMSYPRLKWLLLAYWVIGPLGYLATGGDEVLIGRFWTGGLLPVGVAVLAIGVVAAWRQRTAPLAVLSLALVAAVLAGIHDYLLVSGAAVLQLFAPQAAANRIFLLHYAADGLLVVMGCILSARLVGTLQAIEQLNRTLESRVAEREAALQENYERVRRLERRHAASEERQQIMRDLHDGLGSQLFVTLSLAEAGRMEQSQIAQALRECIADMRLTLEAMSPEENDFLLAWGNFRFRWQQALEASGVASDWQTVADQPCVEVPPHVILQLLRIVQEALTNALKHAGAHQVAVSLHTSEDCIGIAVSDDGRGLRSAEATGGRGLANMRARARRVGAQLEITELHPGLRVSVALNRGTAL